MLTVRKLSVSLEPVRMLQSGRLSTRKRVFGEGTDSDEADDAAERAPSQVPTCSATDYKLPDP